MSRANVPSSLVKFGQVCDLLRKYSTSSIWFLFCQILHCFEIHSAHCKVEDGQLAEKLNQRCNLNQLLKHDTLFWNGHG